MLERTLPSFAAFCSRAGRTCRLLRGRKAVCALLPRIALALLAAAFFSSGRPAFCAATATNGYASRINDLYSRDAEARRKAAETLKKAGTEAVRPLLSAIRDDRSGRIVTNILTAGGREVVNELVKLLQDAEIADRAGSALFRVIGPDNADTVPALLDCMLNNPRANGHCGASLVRTAGSRAKKFIPQILQALGASDRTARVYAAAALGEIGPGAKEVVPGLAGALKDPEAPVRLAAAVALGKFGKKARSAAQELEKAAAGDPSAEVRSEAAKALRAIKGGK